MVWVRVCKFFVPSYMSGIGYALRIFSHRR